MIKTDIIMRKIILLSFFQVLLIPFSFSQNIGDVGLSFSMFNSGSQYRITDAQNTNGVLNRGFFSFSADYYYQLEEKLYVESGLNLSIHFLDKYPFTNTKNVTTYNKYILNIPVGLYKRFWKYGFCNGGFLVDLTYKPGFGTYFGAGIRADSPFGVSLYINPYFKAHSLLSFGAYRNKHQTIESGIKIGVIYPLDKLLNLYHGSSKDRGF